MVHLPKKVDDGERTVPRIRALMREGGEARPKVELAVGDFNDPASLKPAFASVDGGVRRHEWQGSESARSQRVRSITCFSNGFGFGGLNASVVLLKM